MPDKNPLGSLRRIDGVQSRWNREDGVTVVKFTAGTLMRIPKMTYDESMAEARRLELRARIIRALAEDRATARMGELL